MNTYDVIVLGTGGVGSAAAEQLARRGLRVLGLDRFPGGHDQGSSHGHSRIIRKAYFEHSDYVPLLQRAYVLWRELEAAHGEQLLFESGLIEVGPPDGVVIPGVLQCAAEHGLDVSMLDASDVAEQYPGFAIPPNAQAVYERDAGYLLVEQCVLAHLKIATTAGAELRTDQEVVSWSQEQDGVTVVTKTDTWHADKLVITAGAWAKNLLAGLDISLRVVRKHLHWYACDQPLYHHDQGCPVFFYETDDSYFYGFPRMDPRGVKVAEHSGGTEIQNPLSDDKSVEPTDRERIERFLAQCLPGVSRQATDHAVCYYTRSPDEHFIVDRHPQYDRVCFAAGLSGHGFKFTNVLGEALADLACEGTTSLPIEFLRSDRPGLLGD
jgi:monomeric sarcosine oxidase